ncbi:MAG: AAA family ATPase [Candidatus Accumulibacter sp.]|nr:AAA family ATPase [Accumulibacter sp.]
MTNWQIFKGSGKPHNAMNRFVSESPPPPWRRFSGVAPDAGALAVDPDLRERFETARFQASDKEIEVVNAAIHLRRPLLVTGKPGAGKTTLAYALAHELKLGRVLSWSITSRATLQDSLYRYDPIARLQEVNRRQQRNIAEDPDIGHFIRLGPVGTALLPTTYPRVLLIDEIDKSDIDLPNDLLHVFEEGEYEIPELSRLEDRAGVEVMPWDGRGDDDRVTIRGGRVRCATFPFVVLTSNGERELPPAFHRRCLRLHIASPDPDHLRRIVESHLARLDPDLVGTMIEEFDKRRQEGVMATDQLLNALYLLSRPSTPDERTRDRVLHEILRDLGAS